MSKPRILAFSGSLREGSFNQKIATIAADAAREAGADVTLVSLRDYRMPLYDGDLEAAEGMPEAATRLKALFAEHDGLIIASPEYNGFITAALKNSIDWISRTTSEDEPMLSVLKGKKAAIISASPGGYGGARSLAALRMFLGNIYIDVLPEQVSVATAHEAFNEDGSLKDPAQTDAIKKLASDLVAALS